MSSSGSVSYTTRGVAAVLATGMFAAITFAESNVTTYHNDSLRTGWNPSETKLSVSSVAGGTFTLQQAILLDDQVDAQPLYVRHQSIAGQSKPHNVLYVATEGDTVYALDADTGATLLSRSLGTPVPEAALPGRCDNNGPNVGINSTPVISSEQRTMWVIAYTYENNQAIYRLHALDIRTLTDKVTPAVVSATGLLADGTQYSFNAFANRQRPALLYANHSIYAGFGSFCDHRADLSRGWLLGWNASTLAPFASNYLSDSTVSSGNPWYLSSIWMSGYGPSSLGSGNSPVYAMTGNTDPSGATYSSINNLAESLIKVAPDLSRVQDYFTPYTEATLDATDGDFGGGGPMLLPASSTVPPGLLVAGGKDGHLFLIQTSNLGQFNSTYNNVLGTYEIYSCWCGPSYFTGADGAGRVVTSGGKNVVVWKLTTAGTPALVRESSSVALATGQDGGFFTSVSSNGTQPGSAIIWAVSRPTDSNPANVLLYAFDASDGATLYSGVAGTWPNANNNANIVPTVADGHVYVASNQELAIFGVGNPAPLHSLERLAAAQLSALSEASQLPALAPGEHGIYGTVVSANGMTLVLQKRDGARVPVDIAEAVRQKLVAMPTQGSASFVRGYYKNGTLVATHVMHAKPQPQLWKMDR